jgi:hypothetical protein
MIVTSSRAEDVIPSTTPDSIIAGVGHLVTVLSASIVADVVISPLAIEEVTGSRIRIEQAVAPSVDLVVAWATADLVDPEPTEESPHSSGRDELAIVPSAAADQIRSIAAKDEVATPQPRDHVRSVGPDKDVITGSAHNGWSFAEAVE